MFSSNTDSLGYQSFKGVSWALVLGQHLRDTIKGPLLVLGLFLLSMLGLASWACAPIISNPINYYFSSQIFFFKIFLNCFLCILIRTNFPNIPFFFFYVYLFFSFLYLFFEMFYYYYFSY